MACCEKCGANVCEFCGKAECEGSSMACLQAKIKELESQVEKLKKQPKLTLPKPKEEPPSIPFTPSWRDIRPKYGKIGNADTMLCGSQRFPSEMKGG
jgi:hypothetical protein